MYFLALCLVSFTACRLASTPYCCITITFPHRADIKPCVKRTVELNRCEGKGLGFNIIGGKGDTGIFISYISPGSISDQSEKLTAGDQILEVLHLCTKYIAGMYICMLTLHAWPNHSYEYFEELSDACKCVTYYETSTVLLLSGNRI